MIRTLSALQVTNFYFEDLSNPNTKKIHDIADMFSLIQTVSDPTHGRGHTLDLVFHRDSDNLIYSTRTCHDLTFDISILC